MGIAGANPAALNFHRAGLPMRSAGLEDGGAKRMAVSFCYVTAGSRDEALTIGRSVVQERSAAGANVVGGMTLHLLVAGCLGAGGRGGADPEEIRERA
jgi:hypothetical protein